MKKYIAYYRVSTDKQGDKGLGIESQKSIVENYLRGIGIVDESFTEVESGKNNERPMLQKAIETCKATNSTLIIAKLDRLSRNVSFIMSLRDSGVDFVCCDIPEANTLTIGIMAVWAQYEREKISQRTKDALNQIKNNIKSSGFHISKKGNRVSSLGNINNLTDKGRMMGAEVVKRNKYENNNRRLAKAFVLRLHGMSLSQMADRLNEAGFVTSRGCKYHPAQVKRLLE